MVGLEGRNSRRGVHDSFRENEVSVVRREGHNTKDKTRREQSNAKRTSSTAVLHSDLEHLSIESSGHCFSRCFKWRGEYTDVEMFESVFVSRGANGKTREKRFEKLKYTIQTVKNVFSKFLKKNQN